LRVHEKLDMEYKNRANLLRQMVKYLCRILCGTGALTGVTVLAIYVSQIND